MHFPTNQEIQASADSAVMWWYICFGMGVAGLVILIVGFVWVCWWLKEIHYVLSSKGPLPRSNYPPGSVPPLR
jgi:hypothetical protein